MANELVPTGHYKPAAELTDDGEWDLPPIDDGAGRRVPFMSSNLGTARRKSRGYKASVAQEDAANARERGDTAFAVIREADAAEHMQSGWGSGDLRTWLWIAAMCSVFLLMVALVYFLPQGRHNQRDGGNVGGSPTPAIRVY